MGWIRRVSCGLDQKSSCAGFGLQTVVWTPLHYGILFLVGDLICC